MLPEILKLRTLCKENGILNTAELAAFCCIATVKNQQEIARITGQSDSSVGQWVGKFIIYGLVESTFKTVILKNGKTIERTTSIWHSAEGTVLYSKIKLLFQPGDAQSEA